MKFPKIALPKVKKNTEDGSQFEKKKTNFLLFSIRNKIVVSFVIPIIFMVVIGVSAYNKASEGMSQKYQESAIQTIKMATEYVDMSCEFIEAESTKYAFDATLNKYYATDLGVKKIKTINKEVNYSNALESANNYLTEHEDECDAIKSFITSKLSDIQIIIDHFLDDENNITLEGLSYDNDGIQSGFDYEEIYINSHKMISTELFSLDNFDSQTIYATIRCVANIEAECFYYDYDNSVWDPEEKEYIFLESHTNIEEHKAHFACTVSINRETKEIQLAKCHVYLGGDSLVKRNRRKTRPYTTCPDCGEDISIDNDGGNGFCNKCAPNH